MSRSAAEAVDEDPPEELLGLSITYISPHVARAAQGIRPVDTCDPDNQCCDSVAKVEGFSLHAGGGRGLDMVGAYELEMTAACVEGH